MILLLRQQNNLYTFICKLWMRILKVFAQNPWKKFPVLIKKHLMEANVCPSKSYIMHEVLSC